MIFLLLEIENIFWQYFGLVGGVAFILLVILEQKIIRIALAILLMMALIQPVLYLYFLADIEPIIGVSNRVPNNHIIIFILGFFLSAFISFNAIRICVYYFDKFKTTLIKKTSIERFNKTDIRGIKSNLPRAKKDFVVSKYFKKNTVFFGLDKSNKPKRIQSKIWLTKHTQIIGQTETGKGVLASSLLTQAIIQGETVIVVDPKNDEYLPHVLAQEAKKAGVPYYYIDLQGETRQWNPLYNKNKLEIEELFAAGFSLSEQGTDADFYRLNDRKASRIFAIHAEKRNETINDDLVSFVSNNEQIAKNAPKFVDDVEEVASLTVTQTSTGLDLSKVIEKGAVVYIRGSIRNPRVLKLQKMFVLSVMQACENRKRETARHVCLFLDEFKYLISKPSLEALGAIRDKKAHVILAYQSLGDLKDCPKDMSADSVVASVNENCAIKIAYKINDPDTADWLSRMSGKILVDDEMRTIKTGKTLIETKNPERTLRQEERCLIDTNMLQSLPPRCAVMYGEGLADFIFTSPIKVTKKEEYITPTKFEVDASSIKTKDAPNSTAEGLLDVD